MFRKVILLLLLSFVLISSQCSQINPFKLSFNLNGKTWSLSYTNDCQQSINSYYSALMAFFSLTPSHRLPGFKARPPMNFEPCSQLQTLDNYKATPCQIVGQCQSGQNLSWVKIWFSCSNDNDWRKRFMSSWLSALVKLFTLFSSSIKISSIYFFENKNRNEMINIFDENVFFMLKRQPPSSSLLDLKNCRKT